MITFISPAMSFNSAPESLQTPCFLDRTEHIAHMLKQLSVPELKALLKCSDILAEQAFMYYQNFSLTSGTQAVLTFDGAAYKALDAQTLSPKEDVYLEKHMRILNSLYGVLKPHDAIQPYRLEMKTKLSVDGYKNLPAFWGDSLYQKLSEESNGIIVNLASKEYANCIEPYLKDELYITCTFKVERVTGIKTCSVAAKQGRGSIARWCAKQGIENVTDLKDYHELGFAYMPDMSKTSSNTQELVFLRSEMK